MPIFQIDCVETPTSGFIRDRPRILILKSNSKHLPGHFWWDEEGGIIRHPSKSIALITLRLSIWTIGHNNNSIGPLNQIFFYRSSRSSPSIHT